MDSDDDMVVEGRGRDRPRKLARVIHDPSLRNREVALRAGRAEPRRREAYSLQYVDRLSGEPARLAGEGAARLGAAANSRLQ